MKAYKAFNKDLMCLDFTYEIGKTYIHDGEIRMCKRGFHACTELMDIFEYYPLSSRVCEVELGGEIIPYAEDSKVCASRITIVREITAELVGDRTNVGKFNKGKYNAGHKNHGYQNTGNENEGDANSGSENIGNRNTGKGNRGCSNTGTDNVGDRNNGFRNRGDHNVGIANRGQSNAGNYNYGIKNTGNDNEGSYNVGDGNKGDYNVGNFNVGSENIGHFNYGDSETINVFGKPLHRSKWKNSLLPSFVVRFSLSRILPDKIAMEFDYKRAWQIAWDSCPLKENLRITELPNFDYEVFEKITGIDVKKYLE